MALTDLGIFTLADQRLSWLDKRQGLLAQNIANANTPGWHERDLKPFAAFLPQSTPLAPVTTSPLHMVSAESGTSLATFGRPEERAADGNTVQIDRELTKVADTDASQELVTDLYKKYMNMFKTALGR